MGIIQKQGILSAIYTYAGIAIGYINMIWLFPLYLDGGQFGLTRLIISLATIASEFGRFGTPNILVRYFPKFRNWRINNNILTIAILISTFCSFSLFLIFLIGKSTLLGFYNEKDRSLLGDNYEWLIIITIFIVFSELLFTYSRSVWRNVMPTFVKETLLRILQLITIVTFAYFEYSFHVFMTLFALSFGIQNLIMLIYLLAKKELSLPWHFELPIGVSIREILSYGFYMMLNRIPSSVIVHVDVVMVSTLIDLQSSGIYSVAIFMASIIRIPGRLINQITGPIVADLFEKGKLKQIDTLYKQSALTQYIIGSALTILLLLNFDKISQYLQDDFREIWPILFWLCIGNVFDMATGINSVIITNSRYYKFDLSSNILLMLLVIITNAILIPQLGSTGAAISTAMSLITYNAVKLIYLYYKYKFSPFSPSFLGSTIAIAISLITAYLMPNLPIPALFDIVIRSLLFSVILLLLLIWWQIAPELTQPITSRIRRSN